MRERARSQRSLRRGLAGLAGLACIAGLAAAARAEEVGALRARVAELEREVDRLAARLRELEEAGPTPDCACSPAAPAADAWRDPARWRELRQEMSRFEVMRVLGEPGKVSRYEGFERWEYPGALGARVDFDDRGRLRSWRAPAPGR